MKRVGTSFGWRVGYGGILLILLALPACSLAQQPTPEEQQTIIQLQGELAQVESEIESAEEDNRAYSGGLIKTLIALRLEILKTNHALIQQRVHALESGAEIDIVVIGFRPDHELAATRSSPELCVKVRGSSSMLLLGCLGDLLRFEKREIQVATFAPDRSSP